MEAKQIEYQVALSTYRRDQKEMQALVYRMLGKYRQARTPLKERRREIARRLGGLSVSRMIIEAR